MPKQNKNKPLSEWEKEFLSRWDNMLVDDNIPWDEESKQALLDDIQSLLNKQRERDREEIYLEGYKKGVEDEIVCVETSGEHFDLQAKLLKTKMKKTIKKIPRGKYDMNISKPTFDQDVFDWLYFLEGKLNQVIERVNVLNHFKQK